MLIPLNPQPYLFTHLDDYAKTWCVYDHHMFSDAQQRDECIYVGVCKLVDLFHFNDARRNSHWQGIVKSRTVLTTRIICLGDYNECHNERGRMLATMSPRPVCNMQGRDVLGMVTDIICNETGQRFKTQLEASSAMGLSQARLSLHLAGKPNAKTVGGYTFRRGD